MSDMHSLLHVLGKVYDLDSVYAALPELLWHTHAVTVYK